uniref:rRNA methyltransferase n=1 Tax=Desulfobacca acetoxidans TaxID=60893 RepID=A0A7V4LD20_9BACT
MISLGLAVLAVLYAFNHLTFRTNRNDLVGGDQRLIALGEKIERDFGGKDGLVVVVENGSPLRAKAFAEALVARLKEHPREFAEVFYRVDPEQFKKWGLYYLEAGELRELRGKLEEHRSLLAALARQPTLTSFFEGVNQELTGTLVDELFTSFLKEEETPSRMPDLGPLLAALKGLEAGLGGASSPPSLLSGFFLKNFEDLSQEGYFLTENEKYLLILVTPPAEGYQAASHTLHLLRKIIARVQADFPGLQAGVTGPSALEADEMTSAMRDIALATWLSLAGQMFLLILFFRSLKRTLVQSLVLLVGLGWTFGLATIFVGHLNLLSIVFAPLMLGLTIDYGIHWFCRLEEEQALLGRANGTTISRTIRQAAPGIVYAACAAALSFLPLVFTGFKGLAELGLILTFGVLLMLGASLFLLPSLVLVSEGFRGSPEDPPSVRTPEPFLSLGWRRPGLIAGLGLGFTALGFFSLHLVKFDLNPLNLQNQKTESVVWELKLLKDSRYSTAYGAMTAGSLKELEAKKQALKQLATVSHVESILSFLPEQAEAKQELVAAIRPLVSQVAMPASPLPASDPQALAGVLGRIRFKLARALENDPQLSQVRETEALLGRVLPLLNPAPHPETPARLALLEKKFYADLKDKLELLLQGAGAPPPRVEDLPEAVRSRFVSPQGTFLIRAFSAEDIWDPEPLGRFVQDLRRVDPAVVGDPVLLYVFTQAFRNACLWAAGVALLAITLMLWGVLGRLRLALLALIPLFVGTGFTLNLMWLLDLPFNQANILFVPLILGEGIEFGIIILVRWLREESARAITLPASTAKGVLLAALTTTLGFGSLMISGHRGTFSLGLLATVGSLSVLLASLSIFPACLRLLRPHAVAISSPRGVPALKRLLLALVRKETL